MGLLDKIPFLGRKGGTSRNVETYRGHLEQFKKTHITQLRDKMIRDLEYSDTDVNTRVWEGTQGLEITPEGKAKYQLSITEQGEFTLEIPETHPDKESIVKELEDFFDFELSKAG